MKKTIYVKVIPRSSRNSVQKMANGEYKVKLTAPPVDNKANLLLIKVIAEYFGVRRGAVELLVGKTARRKILTILTD